MKRLSKAFLGMLAALCLCAGVVFAVACNKDEEPAAAEEYTVTVTVSGDDHGTETLDPQKEKYAKNDEVTLTVVTDNGYTASATVNGTAADFDANNAYKFKVTENTTVVVTYTSEGSATDAVILDQKYYGTYHDMNGEADDIVISATGVKWGDKAVTLAQPHEDGDLFYFVQCDGVEYELHLNEIEHTVELVGPGYDPDITFLLDGQTIEYTVSITTVGESHGTLTCEPEQDTYAPGTEVTLTLTVEAGYAATVTVNGENVSFEGGVYTFNVNRNTEVYVSYAPSVAEASGNWVNLDNNDEVIALDVEAETLTWSGHDVTNVVINNNDGCLYITFDYENDFGAEINVYAGANVFTLSTHSSDWLESAEYSFFNADIVISANAKYAGNYAEMNGTGTLTVSADGALNYNSADVTLLYDGFGYSFVNEGETYTVDFDAASSYHIQLRTEDTEIDFVRSPLPSVNMDSRYVGTWTGTDGNLTVDENGNFTWDGGSAVAIGSDEGAARLYVTKDGVNSIINANYGYAGEEGTVQLMLELDSMSATNPVFTKTLQKLVLEQEWQGLEYPIADDASLPLFTALEVTADGIALTDADGEKVGVYLVSEVNDVTYNVLIGDDFYEISLDKEYHGITVAHSWFGSAYFGDTTSAAITVNITGYTEEQGSVTLNLEKDTYAAGEFITLFITANTGYELEHVTVNGETWTVKDNENGTYTAEIELTVSVEVVVTFKVAATAGDDTTIDEVWVGDWKNLDGSMTLNLTTDSVVLKVDGETVEVTKASGTDTALTLTTADKQYVFHFYTDFGTDVLDLGENAHKIVTYTEGESVSYLIPDENVTIDSSYNGEWYSQYGVGKLTVDADTHEVKFNDTAVAAVVDCGTLTVGQNTTHACYMLVLEDGGEVYFLAWYTDHTYVGQANERDYDNPTVTGNSESPYTYTCFINELYFDADLEGTWKDNSSPFPTEIVVNTEAGTITIDDEPVPVYNNGGAKGRGNRIFYNDKYYTLTPDPGYPTMMTMEEVVELGMGARTYFVKGEGATIGEESGLLGTEWENMEGTTTLKITEEGAIEYTGHFIFKVFIAETTDSGFYKVIAVAQDGFKMELSYKSGASELTFSDGAFEVTYYKKDAQGGGESTTGFLGLPTGTYTYNSLTIVISADSIQINVKPYGYNDDENLVLTQDMLVISDAVVYGSDVHYTYTWHNVTNDNDKIVHIATNVTAPDWAGLGACQLYVAFGEYDEFFYLPQNA